MVMCLSGITLIDGTGSPACDNCSIVIEGKRFAAVGAEGQVQIPQGTTECWHLPGLTALPGLIDVHVHLLADPRPESGLSMRAPSNELLALRAVPFARSTLEAGFTTVRDMAAPNEPIFALRQAIADGVHSGPRIIASGRCLTITGGHGTQYDWPMAWEVDGPQEFLSGVRRQASLGADLIKVMATRPALSSPYRGGPSFTVEEMQLGVAEAHAAGMLVAAHAHTSVEGIRNAVLAGVDCLEHGDPADDATLDRMAAQGTWLVPTLAASQGLCQAAKSDSFPYGEPVRQRVQQKFELALDTVRRARERGVRIAAGTDAGFTAVWHGGNAIEMALLVQAGLSSMEAIRAATLHAAQACGRADALGTVEAGKLADLVVVDGNPLENIELLQDTRRIRLVIKDGQVVMSRGVRPQSVGPA